MISKTIKYLTLASICVFLLLIGAAAVCATEMAILGQNAKPGQIIKLPIRIDKIDNLAGVRLVLRYDAALLTYKKSSKTAHTASLMHIVNDKKPGILIIVMAGATGIQGENVSLLTLFFEVSGKVSGSQTSEIQITESQLMSDTLVNVAHAVKAASVSISGGETKP